MYLSDVDISGSTRHINQKLAKIWYILRFCIKCNSPLLAQNCESADIHIFRYGRSRLVMFISPDPDVLAAIAGQILIELTILYQMRYSIAI